MSDIAEDLGEVHSEATELLKAGDWLNAGRLEQLLLKAITDSYDYELFEIDYDGEIACVSQDAAEGLGNCLAKATSLDAVTRSQWLNTLLEAFLQDLELGGIDYGAGAADAILKQATDPEWETIESQLRDEMTGQRDRWRNEAIVKLLAKRQHLNGRAAQANQIIQELGSPEQKALLLIEKGQFAEAVAIANQHFTHLPGLITRLADALLAANAPEPALQLINEQEQRHPHWGYRDWLAEYHLQHSDPKTALEAQLRRFLEVPSLERYRTIKQLAKQVKTWSKVEPQLLKQLEPKHYAEVLIEIALDENDLDRALALLPKLKGWGVFSYKSMVAAAAEKAKPQTAIDLYQQMVAGCIAQKNRPAYRQAVDLLKRIKPLYAELDDRVGWTAYLKDLRTQFKHLPALQDELGKAKL